VPVTHVSVSNDGKCMLASCLDSKLRLLETDTGELLNAYSGHQATSMRAEGRLSHDDACVLSTSEDGRVVAWDIVQAVMVRQFKVSDLLQSNQANLYRSRNVVSDANNSSMPSST
jgi:mitogen-activated protein kinase organizer 1